MALPKINIQDGKHKMIMAEDGERVLTPEQNKEYEAQHPNARKQPMRADMYNGGGAVSGSQGGAVLGSQGGEQDMMLRNKPTMRPVYDLGGIVDSIKNKIDNQSSSQKQAAIANMPGQQAPQFGTSTTPAMNQEAFDKGGDVQKHARALHSALGRIGAAPVFDGGGDVSAVEKETPIEMPLRSGATDMDNEKRNEKSAEEAGYPVQHRLAAPLPTEMKVRGEAPKQAVQPEVPAPDPHAIVQQDKLAAMAKGPNGLTDLGTSMIHEKALGQKPQATPVGPDLVTETPTLPTPVGKESVPQATRVGEEQALRNTMLHGATEQERFQAEKDLAELKRRTPWGTAENHPGLLGKIAHGVSSVAQGLGRATVPELLSSIPGSQASIAKEEGIGEKGVEAAQKQEQQAATTAVEQGKPELQQKAQAITEEKNKMTNEAALRRTGYKTGPDGKPEPLPYEEMSEHEQGVYDLNQAKANAQESIAKLKTAQAAPDSPANKLILQKAKDEGRKLDLAGKKLGLDVDKYKADYLGVDHDNNPLAGAATTAEGKPIGTKVGAGNVATSQRLNKADLSQNVQLNVKNAEAMIDANPDLFGKVAGRFTTAQQMIGSNDPAISKLGIEVHNMAVASAGIHGQRGQAAVEAYEKDILNKFRNSPEATKAGMDELSGSVQTFIDDAKAGKKVAPTPGGAAAAAAPGGKPQSAFEIWEAGQKKATSTAP